MGTLRDRQARVAAKKVLGSAGRIVRHRADGAPVVQVDGEDYVYRRHGSERYFRLLVLCSVCRTSQVTWRGPRITADVDLATLDPEPLSCPGCLHDRGAAMADAKTLRAKVIQDRERMERQLRDTP
jgi:hypothetical protein